VAVITDDLFIGAWPTKYHREKIISLGVTLVVATILESIDKELDQPPLTLVHTRGTDLGPRLFFPMGQIFKGVEAAVSAIGSGGKVMVFCKAGKHRSATMTSCVLVGLGHPADEAIEIVKAGRDKVEINDNHRKAIYKFEQAWHERHPQG
jgi:protein-tyrosine phosphatase